MGHQRAALQVLGSSRGHEGTGAREAHGVHAVGWAADREALRAGVHSNKHACGASLYTWPCPA